MLPTLVRMSKASRRPLTPKRGNKDFYKGTRQAQLPGGLRTGAPGKYFGKSRASYKLLDEKVRYFVAPPIQDIAKSPLRPYVANGKHLSREDEESTPFGVIGERLSGEQYLSWTREAKKIAEPISDKES
ncbi:hypothetical protein BD410DRAFT_740825 [Rickenella mellea]|uniref:Uncharacterized protein n=1 Tax=Rickenella mellea TaxID=50990 RepID=A0A4Y7QK73_9AGAM|nr:hypothetical protein BD410DRAFT_740825 [Rickenella mellea]